MSSRDLGGSRATDELDQAHGTQVRLAVGDDPAASVPGEYFDHMKKLHPLAVNRDASIQDRLPGFSSRAQAWHLGYGN
jgi:hypothetical protein